MHLADNFSRHEQNSFSLCLRLGAWEMAYNLLGKLDEVQSFTRPPSSVPSSVQWRHAVAC